MVPPDERTPAYNTEAVVERLPLPSTMDASIDEISSSPGLEREGRTTWEQLQAGLQTRATEEWDQGGSEEERSLRYGRR